MNKHSRFASNGFKFAVMALAIGGAGNAMAASATAAASSTVITPINISKTVDLAFGSIGAGATSGTVTITPGGARTAGGGAILAGGVGAAAQFSVTGEGGKGYTLTVSSAPLTNGSGGTMTFTPISDFTASAVTTSNTGAGLLAGTGSAGTQTVFVGGVLAVAANQAVGVYSGSVTASVDYN